MIIKGKRKKERGKGELLCCYSKKYLYFIIISKAKLTAMII